MRNLSLISLMLALPVVAAATSQPQAPSRTQAVAHPAKPTFSRVGKPVPPSTWPDAAAIARTNPVAPAAVPAAGGKPAGMAAAARPVVPQAPVAGLAELPEARRVLAEQVYVGRVPCEHGASVTVSADAQQPGHFWVQLQQQRFHMVPVSTSTGAIRLEDAQAGMVWLQLANKSMLMNQRQGRRLVDACMNPAQLTAVETMRREKHKTLFDEIGAPAGSVAMKY